jgi:hypothetical protein
MTGGKRLNPVEVFILLAVVAVSLYAVFFVFAGAEDRDINVKVYKSARTLAQNTMKETMLRRFKFVKSRKNISFGGDLKEYSCDVQVDYVLPQALDRPVPRPTDYKRVRVEVRHPELKKPMVLESIKGNVK